MPTHHFVPRRFFFHASLQVSSASLALVVAAALLFGVATPALAQTYTILYNFPGGALSYADTGLTLDGAGNLYGSSQGAVFRLSHRGSGWALEILSEFPGGSGGSSPGQVIFGPDGALYGTTSAGGSDCNCGVVFRLSPPPNACGSLMCAWTETVLYRFEGGNDGANPGNDRLIFDQAGNIYGTTQNGGDSPANAGTVYELSPSNGGWTETVLYRFQGGADGANPVAGVTFDQSGNLYGTTTLGGGQSQYGTVYRLTSSASGWTESILYGLNYPGYPFAGVVIDPAGNLYGATLETPGVVYELTPVDGDWTYSVLYAFEGLGEFGGVEGDLLRDSAGNLYGAVLLGGVNYGGTVFEVNPSDGGSRILHSFSLYDNNGSGPAGGVVRDASGNLYGRTVQGGQYNQGVIYQISPAR